MARGGVYAEEEEEEVEGDMGGVGCWYGYAREMVREEVGGGPAGEGEKTIVGTGMLGAEVSGEI